MDLTMAADPQVVLSHDRGASLAPGLMWGLIGLVGGLTVGPVDGLVGGLVFGILGGLTFGLFEHAWGAFVVTRCWLGMQRRLPWRVMAFLADAHQRGVLRQVGAVYQFRHVELQRHLATGPS